MKKEFYEISRYSIAGVLNTAFALGVYTIMVHVGVWYMMANIVSFFVGVLNGYFLNKIWVFKCNNSIKKQIIVYFINSLILFIFSSILLFSLVEILNLNKIISQYITTCIIIILNYIVNKVLIFKKRSIK